MCSRRSGWTKDADDHIDDGHGRLWRRHSLTSPSVSLVTDGWSENVFHVPCAHRILQFSIWRPSLLHEHPSVHLGSLCSIFLESIVNLTCLARFLQPVNSINPWQSLLKTLNHKLKTLNTHGNLRKLAPRLAAPMCHRSSVESEEPLMCRLGSVRCPKKKHPRCQSNFLHLKLASSNKILIQLLQAQ